MSKIAGRGRPRREFDDAPHKTSIMLPKSMNDALERLAIQQRRSKADIMREYIDAGMKPKIAENQSDYIRQQLRQELEAYMAPQIERIIKVGVKGSTMSAASFYLFTDVLFNLLGGAFVALEVVPPNFHDLYHEILESAKRKGVDYVKQPEGVVRGKRDT